MADSLPYDDMPEGIDEDGDRVTFDYESPYPIDDRHLLDSVYGVLQNQQYSLDTILSAVNFLKFIGWLLFYGLVGSLIGLAVGKLLI